MTSPSIFIVEDELIVAEDIKQTLKSLGYTVAGHAKSGELALDKIKEKKPDLVLMDIHLAGKMDGIETAGKIHSLYDVPIIYLTAHADTSLLERAKITEPHGYILKPYDERELHSVIEMALHKHATEQALHQSEETKRVLVNATEDILFLVDTHGTLLVVNDALAGLTGKTTGELEGSSAYDLVAKKILTPKMACWHLNPDKEKRIQFEEQAGGIWYDTTIYPVYEMSGNPLKYAVYIRDITQKKKTDEQLEHNQEFFRSLIEEASDIIAIMNRDGTFARPSPSLNRALDYPTHVIMNTTIFDLVVPDDLQMVKKIFADIVQQPGMIRPVRLKFKTKVGTPYAVKGILSNLFNNVFIDGIVLNGWIETE